METRLDDLGFVELTSRLERTGEILDLIAACIEHDSNGLLVEAGMLADDFADLSSGFAGEFVQKMQNYGIKVAAIFSAPDGYSDRFQEFLREARRGPQFRVFDERAEAETWLSFGR